MTRPKIFKDTRFGGRPWCATNPYKPEIWHLCETWEEALEYVADALRNPLPLELDRDRSLKDPLRVIYRHNYVWIDDWDDNEIIVLHPNHWRPLARALTRLADLEGVK